MKRNRKPSSRPRTCSPQRKQPQTLGRRRGGRAHRERHSSTRSSSHIPRSQSLSPLRAGNTQRLARLSLGSADWGTTSTSQPVSTNNTSLFHFQSTDGREELSKVCLHSSYFYSTELLLGVFFNLYLIQISPSSLSPNSSSPVLCTITCEKV